MMLLGLRKPKKKQPEYTIPALAEPQPFQWG